MALADSGKLVVIELERESDSRQDLQALRYAAYPATLRLDDLIELYVSHRARRGEEVGEQEARDAFAAHVVDGDIEAIDDDEKPRIILVATDFQVGVTATSLWLRENYDVDISCVQLVPYRLDDKRSMCSTSSAPRATNDAGGNATGMPSSSPSGISNRSDVGREAFDTRPSVVSSPRAGCSMPDLNRRRLPYHGGLMPRE